MKENHDDPVVSPPNREDLLREVLRLTREGSSSREIGEKLGISKTTIGNWLRAERRKRAATNTQDPAPADPQGTPHTECEEYTAADAQGIPHTPCEENKGVETAKKADPPRLTWQQQREILLHEAAEKKRKLKRFTDPKYCAYRWGQ